VPRVIALIAVFAASGCDGSDGPGDSALTDTSADADSSATSVGVDLRPCPEGWREEVAGVDVLCEPWPESGRADCPLGEAHFPGTPGCEPLGTACPSGAFGEDAADGDIFVDPSAGAGGDGGRARPYATIAEALVTATAGNVVSLSRGAHPVSAVIVPSGVVLRGACAAETQLEVSGASAGVALTGAGATLANLRVSRTVGGGSCVSGSAFLSAGGAIIEGVQIDCGGGESAGNAIEALSGGLEGTRIRLSGANFGVFSFGGGDVALDEVTVDDCVSGIGVWGMGLSDAITIRRASVFNTTTLGFYVLGTSGTVVFDALVAEDLRQSGVAIGTAPSATVRDVVVRNLTTTNDITGHGVAFGSTNGVMMERVRVERVRGVGVAAVTGATVMADHLLVQDVEERDCDPAVCGSQGGSGVVSISGSTFTASGFAVRRVALCGLHAESGAEIAASSGEVVESTIGACVDDDYDLSRLMDDVRYRDNEANLDSGGLAVPDVALPMLGDV